MNASKRRKDRLLTASAQLGVLLSVVSGHAIAGSAGISESTPDHPVNHARIVGSLEQPMLIVPMQVPQWANDLGVTQVERVYKGICGHNGAVIDLQDLYRHADRDFQQMNTHQRGSTSELVGESPAFRLTYGNSDFTLHALYLPPMRRAIEYIDTVLDNRVEIGASIALFDFSSDNDEDNDDVIGSAGSDRYTIPWSVYVEGLRSQSQRDNPAFANALPDTSIQVLYDGSTSATTETEVRVTEAQLRAIFGDTVVPQGEAVSITLNSSVNWNFVGCDVAPVGSQSSLIDVAVHEFTHSLGFTSDISEGGGNSNSQIQGLDIARFRAANFPISLATFETNPRIGEQFTGENHFYSSFPTGTSTLLESGDDNQPSHLLFIPNFEDKLGVMDPVLNRGASNCPNFYSNADVQPLDDMGWRQTITNGFSDCNNNLIIDLIDILSGTSQDVDNDNIPDECETFEPGNADPSSGIQGVSRTIYTTPGLTDLASFDPNSSSVTPIVGDILPTMVSFYNHGSNATRVTVFEFEMFVPARDEFAFRVDHPDDMDLMIDGVLVGSSINSGSLTRTNSSTRLSKQMFMQLDSGWHTVRIRGLSNGSQPHFDFVREARSLGWQQPPTSNLRIMGYQDCDSNGVNDTVDVATDFDFNNVSSIGTIANAFETITIDTCGSDFDTELVIWDIFGEVVSENDDFCGPAPARQSQITANLPAGQYLVGTTGYNAVFGSGFSVDHANGCSASGNYVLNVSAPVGVYNESNSLGSNRTRILTFVVGEADCDGDGTPDAEELDCDGNGIPDDCEIPTQADADADGALGVIGNESEIITFSTCGSNFDTEIAIFDASGNLIEQNDDFCGPSPARQSQIDINLSAGTYYLAVGGYDTIFSDNFGIETNINETCGDSGDLQLAVGSFSVSGSLSAGRALLARFEVEEAADCPADMDNNRVLDFFDVSAFLDRFGDQDPIADFTNDGLFDFFDVSAFLDAFGDGCP